MGSLGFQQSPLDWTTFKMYRKLFAMQVKHRFEMMCACVHP